MRVILFDHTENPEEKIAMAAAVCYDSDTSPGANERRIKNLLAMKHLATLRFAYATFKIEDISRTCSHQLVRHAHLSYLQESQRYVKQLDTPLIMPPSIANSDDKYLLELWTELEQKSNAAYRYAIENGIQKGDARFMLPQAARTSIFVTGNFQAWMNFLQLRTDKKAQWEIRKVALTIGKELATISPIIFSEYKGE